MNDEFENINLSDYEILNIKENETNFRIIKNAYHSLCKIFHPDSNFKFNFKLSKEEKNKYFQHIEKAYNKLKLLHKEIDLPDFEIKYPNEDYNISKLDIKSNEEFNKLFEEKANLEHSDNPFSIFYNKKNINEKSDFTDEENKYIISKDNNNYTFGINYVDDHSTNKFIDFNNIEKNNIIISEDNYKEITLEQLIIERDSLEINYVKSNINKIDNNVSYLRNKIENYRDKLLNLNLNP